MSSSRPTKSCSALGMPRAGRGKIGKREPPAWLSEEENASDQRDRTDLQQREHEKHRAARCRGTIASPRIMTAPPRLMISQATRKLTASCRPKTPRAPMRLTAAPKIQPT